MFNLTVNPFTSIDLDTILFEDCIEGMKALSESTVDLIIADPPFGIDFNSLSSAYNRDSRNVIQGYEEITENYGGFTYAWLEQVVRLMKDHATAYVFSGYTNLKEVMKACESLNLHTVNHIIWKYNFGLFTRRKFVTSHYHILLVAKNKKSYYFNKTKHYPSDVWTINREYQPRSRKNGTNLPLKLVQRCIDYSSKPGDIVFDPFMGNGTTAVAAK